MTHDDTTQHTRVERSPEGFAGMPTSEAVPASPPISGSRRISAGMALPTGLLRPEQFQRERDYVEFQLPEKVLGLEWRTSGYSTEALRFAMTELTPEEEDRAVAMAGQGIKIQQSFNEMVKASLYTVGGHRVNYEEKSKWLKAIGPRARKLVERCFNELNGIEEAAGESILATATPGRG